jgi:hypothetical protein
MRDSLILGSNNFWWLNIYGSAHFTEERCNSYLNCCINYMKYFISLCWNFTKVIFFTLVFFVVSAALQDIICEVLIYVILF